MYIGIDLVEVGRIKDLFTRYESFMDRIYTPREVEYSLSKRNKFEHLAARFAVKEAVVKALGTGMKWTDIELLNDSSGRPYLKLYGRAKELAEEKGVGSWDVSITHTKDHAIGQVLLVTGAY
ncbi:MAG: holo-ACP synthase [Candidatus Brocadiales bacterium]|nr:holo-ACP synthase [Candidatus Bathyanammoxibius sp.]